MLITLDVIWCSFDVRHLPPKLFADGEILIHRLLSMFHPRPFVMSRFAPQGSVACVRAFNADYLDIVFRYDAYESTSFFNKTESLKALLVFFTGHAMYFSSMGKDLYVCVVSEFTLSFN